MPKQILLPLQKREQAARRTAAGLGYNECVTYTFIDEAAAALFGGGDDASKLENPISSDMSHMRPDLLPGLLRAAARNQARGFAELGLFEIGPVYLGAGPDDQRMSVAGIRAGLAGGRHWAARPRAVEVGELFWRAGLNILSNKANSLASEVCSFIGLDLYCIKYLLAGLQRCILDRCLDAFVGTGEILSRRNAKDAGMLSLNACAESNVLFACQWC